MGVTLRSPRGHFGINIGSFWVSVGGFGSLDGHFAMIVESPWVHDGPFSDNVHFPMDFNDFIYLWGELWITACHFRVTFGV